MCGAGAGCIVPYELGFGFTGGYNGSPGVIVCPGVVFRAVDVWPAVCAKPDNVMTNRKTKATAKGISTLLPRNITPPVFWFCLPDLIIRLARSGGGRNYFTR
jgi:hypothetical protein